MILGPILLINQIGVAQLDSPGSSVNNPEITEQRLPGRLPVEELEASPQPTELTDEEKNQLRSETEEANAVPDVQTSSEPVLNLENGTQTVVNVTNTNASVLTAVSPEVEETVTNSGSPITSEPSLNVTEMKSFTPGGGRLSYTMETSVANKDSLIFYTGNWFAARSVDGGLTWGYVNPLQTHKVTCRDQEVIYDPNRGIFVWYRQGGDKPENHLALDWSSDTFTWNPYRFSASDLNSSWSGQFSDYPSLALTEEYLT